MAVFRQGKLSEKVAVYNIVNPISDRVNLSKLPKNQTKDSEKFVHHIIYNVNCCKLKGAFFPTGYVNSMMSSMAQSFTM